MGKVKKGEGGKKTTVVGISRTVKRLFVRCLQAALIMTKDLRGEGGKG